MKIKDIIKDVVENLHYHEKNMMMVGKNYYNYPRGKFTSTLMLGTTTNGLGVVGCLPRADMYFWRVNDPHSHRQIMVLYTTYDTSGSIEAGEPI